MLNLRINNGAYKLIHLDFNDKRNVYLRARIIMSSGIDRYPQINIDPTI